MAEQAALLRDAIEGDDYPARFALALARMDADFAAAAVDERQLGLGLTAAARDWLRDAERSGCSGQDYPAVLAHILHAVTKGPQR